jgi:hypothetical protein
VPRTLCPTDPLEPRIDTNVTGDGPDHLGTDDSDGNGILDRDEWGSVWWSPIDTDDDGTPDYQDTDDDDDGLSDLYDPDRTQALPFARPTEVGDFGLLTNV